MGLILITRKQRPNREMAFGSYMYGAEYRQPVGGPLYNQEATCAVCESPPLSSKILMIPARDECYPGWEKLYHGRLASGGYTETATQFVCLDENPEMISGTTTVIGKLFYSVKAYCDNLPCPLYNAHKTLTCVLCALNNSQYNTSYYLSCVLCAK